MFSVAAVFCFFVWVCWSVHPILYQQTWASRRLVWSHTGVHIPLRSSPTFMKLLRGGSPSCSLTLTLRAVINVGLSFEVVCECRLQNKSCLLYVLHLPCEKANLLCCCYSSSEHGSVESPSITSLQPSVTSSGVLWRRPPCVIFRWLVLKMSSKFLHLFCPFSFFTI